MEQKAFYRDSYGCKASITPTRDGGAKLIITLQNGTVSMRKNFPTLRGARSAMGRCSDGWERINA